MKSYRHERMRELRECVEERNKQAGKVAQTAIKARTPVGTPSSTGHPNYPVTSALMRSIELHVDGSDGFSVGTNKRYAPYVHNGTYNNPGKHGNRPWSIAEAVEWSAIRVSEYGMVPGVDNAPGRNDGVPARAFLVYGLLTGVPAYKRIYGKQCKGGPPYG